MDIIDSIENEAANLRKSKDTTHYVMSSMVHEKDRYMISIHATYKNNRCVVQFEKENFDIGLHSCEIKCANKEVADEIKILFNKSLWKQAEINLYIKEKLIPLYE